MEFEKFPTSSSFSYWQLNFGIEVCSGSCHPSDAMSWIREIEAAQTVDDLSMSHSIIGNQYTNIRDVGRQRRDGFEEDLNKNCPPSSSRTTHRLHDLRILSCYRDQRVHSGIPQIS